MAGMRNSGRMRREYPQPERVESTARRERSPTGGFDADGWTPADGTPKAGQVNGEKAVSV